MPSPQKRYWLLTIRFEVWNPPAEEQLQELYPGIAYLKGQQEVGEGGFRHWQVIAAYRKPQRLSSIKAHFGNTVHAEPSRSKAADDYVWKEETAVADSRFELGQRAIKRQAEADWERVWDLAKANKIIDIPADIRIRSYHTFKRIAQDYMVTPDDLTDVCGIWYYGVPGSGKSHSARENYPKSFFKPCNKWWDGYQGQENVIIDDFDLNHKCLGHHLKIWADKYGFIGESKGGSITIRPKNIVVTSNYSIQQIFGEDEALCLALKRRFVCRQFLNPFNLNLALRQ